jgi:hypothetical protein
MRGLATPSAKREVSKGAAFATQCISSPASLSSGRRLARRYQQDRRHSKHRTEQRGPSPHPKDIHI